jgi:1-deoxy-D-xylulose-5-phosphate reductoisomerase
MMNKGLELIEAFHLFPVEARQLAVLIHPQSIVHALVEYCDGSVMAQLASPDMRTPIALALSWPDRMDAPTARLDLTKIGTLTFEEPDRAKFPALRLAEQALAKGGIATAVLNAANEIAVEAFLDGRIGFADIPAIVARCLDLSERRKAACNLASIDDILALDHEVRGLACDLIAKQC